MSVKIISGLLLIGLFVVLIVYNAGHVSISLVITQLTMPKPIFMLGTFASGLITGMLFCGKK
jgi:uncharacterized integral membrane protein